MSNDALERFATSNVFTQAGGVELPLSRDDLDAAISRSLSGIINARFERVENGPEILYHLLAGGKIKISRVSSTRAGLTWLPPVPLLPPNFINSGGIETAKRITAQVLENFARNVKFILMRLGSDSVWGENGEAPKRAGGNHKLTEDKREEARIKYNSVKKLIEEKDLPVQVACDRAALPKSTYYSYKKIFD